MLLTLDLIISVIMFAIALHAAVFMPRIKVIDWMFVIVFGFYVNVDDVLKLIS